ncbi:hypothetical protein BDB01DRAFT_855141 [Pilobolus umbonatus]|nr:hypothetical protein BDB01DRAFT_855141 [Pilobolus umbonatus]
MFRGNQGPSHSTIFQGDETYCQLQVEQKSLFLEPYIEGGPGFYSIIKLLEQRNSDMEGYVKEIINASLAVQEAKQLTNEAELKMFDVLRKTPLCDPLFNHYLDGMKSELDEENNRMIYSMQNMLIDPLQKMYQADIKTYDIKKREFRKAFNKHRCRSRKYFVKRFTEKDKSSLDKKFKDKQLQFELARFDYYHYLRDLHGGKKHQEILFHLFSLFQRQQFHAQSVYQLTNGQKPGLDELGVLLEAAAIKQAKENTERKRKRNSIRDSLVNDTNRSSLPVLVVDIPDSELLKKEEIEDLLQFKDDKSEETRDSHQMDDTEEWVLSDYMSGCLFINQDNTDNNWTESCCAVRKRLLYEYSEDMTKLFHKPIDLRFSYAQPTDIFDLPSCFEVKTTRYYRATNDSKMYEWIEAINKSNTDVLKSNGSMADLREMISPEEIDSDNSTNISECPQNTVDFSDRNNALLPALADHKLSQNDNSTDESNSSPTSSVTPLTKLKVKPKIEAIISQLNSLNKVSITTKVPARVYSNLGRKTVINHSKQESKIASTISQFNNRELTERLPTEEKNIVCDTMPIKTEATPMKAQSTSLEGDSENVSQRSQADSPPSNRSSIES